MPARRKTARRSRSKIFKTSRRPKMGAFSGGWLAFALIVGLAVVIIQSVTAIICEGIVLLGFIVSLFFAPKAPVPARRASTERRGNAGKTSRPASSSPKPGTAASGPNARCPYCSAGRNCPGPGKCQCKGCKAQKKSATNGSGKPELLTRSQLKSKRMVQAEKQHVRTVEKGKQS